MHRHRPGRQPQDRQGEVGNKRGIVRVDGAVAMLMALELAKRARAIVPINIETLIA